MSIIFRIFVVKINLLQKTIDMHNFYAKYAKILDICKRFSKNLVNELGNVPRRGVVPKFSGLEVIALSLTAESLSIDSENCLFVWLNHHRDLIPNLISRRQFNTRRKLTISVCNAIRERIANEIDGGESFFCIDSKPIEVCRIARSSRCKLGKSDYETAPSFGFCASQNTYYYGYKLHAVCGLSGVIHSFDITKANVHDINYLKDVKYEYHDCSIFGDRGYISASMQLDLFESANIRLEVPYRLNQKDWKPTFIPFAKARKRIETDFSQFVGQFMLNRNYAKQPAGMFVRVICKIASFTTLQYVNYLSGKLLGHIKYALD